MRFLADESCDFVVVRAPRSEGHDVLAVSEMQRRSIDRELMELARADNRILLTEDKDFGLLVFVGHMKSPGVVLIRFPAPARHLLGSAVRRLMAEITRLNWQGPSSCCSQALSELAAVPTSVDLAGQTGRLSRVKSSTANRYSATGLTPFSQAARVAFLRAAQKRLTVPGVR